MIINGVTLPDFPEGVFEKSSYAIITRGYAPSISIDMYSIRVLPEPAIYFPPSMVDEYGIVTTMTPEYYTYNYTVGSGNTEWTDAGAVSGSLDMQIGTVGVVESEVVWSNHDIYTVTAYNSDTGEVTVGSEIYFADSYRVSIGRSLMDKIATEVNRLWGTTDQMNAETMRDMLQMLEVAEGIRIGDVALPPILEDVLAQYPYVVIARKFENNLYRFMPSASPFKFLLSGAYETLSDGTTTQRPIYDYDPSNKTWVENGTGTGFALVFNGVETYELLWSNHDIVNQETNEVYFPPLEAIDSDRVSIGYGLFNDMVKNVQRLSGTTEKMNALKAYWWLTTLVAVS